MTLWPEVVAYLVATLPTLPGWTDIPVLDTDPATASAPATYVVVARSTDDTSSGSYVRLYLPSGLISETGSVRVQIVTRSGSAGAGPLVRDQGFALVEALEDHLFGNQTLGGVLGAVGVVTATVEIASISNANGVAQSLSVSVNYSSQT